MLAWITFKAMTNGGKGLASRKIKIIIKGHPDKRKKYSDASQFHSLERGGSSLRENKQTNVKLFTSTSGKVNSGIVQRWETFRILLEMPSFEKQVAPMFFQRVPTCAQL